MEIKKLGRSGFILSLFLFITVTLISYIIFQFSVDKLYIDLFNAASNGFIIALLIAGFIISYRIYMSAPLFNYFLEDDIEMELAGIFGFDHFIGSENISPEDLKTIISNLPKYLAKLERRINSLENKK